MCILSVKMAAKAVPKLPQGFTGGKDLRTEVLPGLDWEPKPEESAWGDRNLMAKSPWHFIILTKSTNDTFTETYPLKADSTHRAKRTSLEKALQVERQQILLLDRNQNELLLIQSEARPREERPLWAAACLKPRAGRKHCPLRGAPGQGSSAFRCSAPSTHPSLRDQFPQVTAQKICSEPAEVVQEASRRPSISQFDFQLTPAIRSGFHFPTSPAASTFANNCCFPVTLVLTAYYSGGPPVNHTSASCPRAIPPSWIWAGPVML